METRHSNSRVEGGGGLVWCAHVCVRNLSPSSHSSQRRLLFHLAIGWWPTSLVPMSLPQSSLTWLPRAHGRYYHKAGTKSNNYPTCTTVLTGGTRSLSGPACSNRQSSPAGSFTVCAAPVSGSIVLWDFNRKLAERSFQFCIKRCTTVFLIGYVAINTANNNNKNQQTTTVLVIPQERVIVKIRQRLFYGGTSPERKHVFQMSAAAFNFCIVQSSRTFSSDEEYNCPGARQK